MIANQKHIPSFAFFIAFCALFVSGCNSENLPETEDAITADSLVDECDSVAGGKGSKPLTIIITNLVSSKSPVNIVFYQAKHKFLSKTDRLKRYRFVSDGNILTAQIKDLNYGEFAIATYQDVNNDGKIERNFMGIPKEPYGFSNNFKPTIKPPRFGDCKFAYSANADTLTIAMIR